MIQREDSPDAERFQPVSRANVAQTPEWQRLTPDVQEAITVVASVLPFRTNTYVMRDLIDWDRVPDDPIFQLTFPQRGMLCKEDYEAISKLIAADAPAKRVEQEANRIRLGLNPHPAGQLTHNVPTLHGEPLPGLQHKYRETVLCFPGQGQTCHAYCTFCFRWPQFVGLSDLKFATRDHEVLVAYLEAHPKITDVLFTGGDPMVMTTKLLRRYIEPLLDPSLDRVQSIRIGTKALAYWPQRFARGEDADDLMRLFDQVAAAGRHLSIMAHASHPVELAPDIAREAIQRIRATGAQIRMQAPILRHINDDPNTWATLWKQGVRLGAIPYYMFVARDTGAHDYFEVPLARATEIFRRAYRQVSGLARTVRGPSMSAFPGKICVKGVKEIGDSKVFVLEYIQARDPLLVRRPFFAQFDPAATWFDQLVPATDGDREFFPKSGAQHRQTQPVSTDSGLVYSAGK